MLRRAEINGTLGAVTDLRRVRCNAQLSQQRCADLLRARKDSPDVGQQIADGAAAVIHWLADRYYTTSLIRNCRRWISSQANRTCIHENGGMPREPDCREGTFVSGPGSRENPDPAGGRFLLGGRRARPSMAGPRRSRRLPRPWLRPLAPPPARTMRWCRRCSTRARAPTS